ncbi:MAG: FkbM family methyltransferase [Verrucomicrobiota bacterium]
MDSSEVTDLQLQYIRSANQALEALKLHWDFNEKHRAYVKSISDWISYHDIFVEQEYDHALKDVLNSGDNIKLLDIGANVGYFLLRAMVLRDAIKPSTRLCMHAVEGCSKTYKDLCDRIESQLEVGDKLALHLGIVGKLQGTARFTDYDFSGWNTLYERSGTAIAEERKVEEREFLDLRAVFDELETVDLLKVNAEGSELVFFETYHEQLAKVREIVFVMHPKKYDIGACHDILKRVGFERIERVSKNWVFRAFRDKV